MGVMLKSESAPLLLHLPKLKASAIPNLPGNRISPRLFRSNHARSQCFGFVNGQRMEVQEGLSHDRPKFVKAPKAVDTWRQGTFPNSVYREVFAAAPQEWEMAPAWDIFDRHVLRFYGFTKEIMTEANLENHRVRKVKLLYYLEDDTVQIMEPKVECSGTHVFSSSGGGLNDKGMSSCILRRHRVPIFDAQNEAYITPKHLCLGQNIKIYGTTYCLTDCDTFTREYYASIDDPQPTEYSPKAAPLDSFSLQAMQKPTDVFPPKTNEKYYMEMRLGGGHCNRNMQSFLESSDKVCRFYGMINDLATSQFERRPFIILVFVVDNTIEIREQYPLNCGRENFPLFYRRHQMVRSGDLEVQGPIAEYTSSNDILKVADFATGKTIRMCNMDFFIYDCDGFTRKYFENELKIKLGPCVDVRLPHPSRPNPPTPPYTGYGTWDDSMGSVQHLVPKVPRKDLHKLFFNQGKVLRFSAKFGGEVTPEDLNRRFLIAYYLQDDTLLIHEPPQRNLGIVTGKFLEKSIHFNQVTQAVFKPDDLMTGKTIKVLSHEFLMLDMDEYTRTYMKSQEVDAPMPVPPVNLEVVLTNLRESMRQQYPYMRDVFHKFDVDRNGVLCYYEFDRALQKFAFQLTPEETLCIMRNFDKEHSGQVNYNEFVNSVFADDYSDIMRTNQSAGPVDADESTIQSYAARAALKTLDRSEQEKVRDAVKTIGHLLYSRPNTEVRLRDECRRQCAPGTSCTVDMIRNSFLSLGFTFENELIDRAIQFLMRNPNEEALIRVDYKAFLAQLKATYHDMAAPR